MPELRHDPIQKRWVIIAPERGNRPFDFKIEENSIIEGGCAFCEGNEHMTPPEIIAIRKQGTQKNGVGWEVRVVANKFPALRIEGELNREGVGYYDKMNGIGAHEVIIETPNHSLDISDLPIEDISKVFKIYRERLIDLQRDPRMRYILIFRNRGIIAGASLSHPHSQLIATPITPRTVANELNSAKEHYALKERCIFCDLMEQEIQTQSRIVVIDDHFITYCPFASRFPFEMWVFPRRHSHDFGSLSDSESVFLSRHLKEVLTRMRKSLGSLPKHYHIPYNFLLHTAPSYQYKPRRVGYWVTISEDWHWHLEILPRLTSTAGFEWGTGFYINPTSPEEAAKYLREIEI